MKRTTYIITAAVAVILAIVLFSHRQYHFEWEAERPSSAGLQPYDMELFDKLLYKSLPNGYDVIMTPAQDTKRTHADSPDSECYGKYPVCEAIASISPADTSLLVVHKYTWHTKSSDILCPLFDLIDFARKGGEAVYVTLPNPDTYGMARIFKNKISELDYSIYPGSEYGYQEVPYTKRWIEDREYDHAILATHDNQRIDIDERFAPNFFYNIRSYYGRPMVSADLRSSYSINGYGNAAYAMRIDFPDTGGMLFITTLNPYFSNIGLQLDGGPEVISYALSQIDDKPVARIDYQYISRKDSYERDSANALDKVRENPSLYFLWAMLLLIAFFALASGLMRLHPVAHGHYELDKTDVIAVREHKFRNSPLLLFLFQCSWLYSKADDYTPLFENNLRRVTRAVTKATGIELLSATPQQLDQIAHTMASRLRLDPKTIANDLAWLVEKAGQKIYASEYYRSQKIADRFPL